MVTEIVKELKMLLAVEDLRFKKDRMASNFAYSKVIEAEMRSDYKKGVEVKEVWPAHTSTIGYYKYKECYGITIHEAAAMVIARRAMGYREK
ncbi:hypothetical protein [Thermoanaerobacterium sp. RBIITD]|uniref:hypothetical protein n=1 Tax=Thermoanaerobacterium sp. RBIITD TaxID=1550240 RepID=UPI000BB91DEE|nr:hypothetical protein [Thermoanaerobacterium sp. RBIITD]